MEHYIKRLKQAIYEQATTIYSDRQTSSEQTIEDFLPDVYFDTHCEEQDTSERELPEEGVPESVELSRESFEEFKNVCEGSHDQDIEDRISFLEEALRKRRLRRLKLSENR